MDPRKEPLQPILKDEPERRAADPDDLDADGAREELGLDEPEAALPPMTPPGPRP